MACKFCHTGLQGFSRHLKAEEIIAQFVLAQSLIAPKERITNIVFMGQGEPLHNFVQVKKSIEILQDDFGASLGKDSVCISTVGHGEGMRELLQWPQVNLAISLHSARENIRGSIVPLNQRYPLEQVLQWGQEYARLRKNKTLFEMTILKDLNDNELEIKAIIEKLSPQWAKINLIAFNPFPGTQFESPELEKLAWMQNQLMEHGFVTIVRKKRGDDVLGACGQLNTKHSSPKN